MTIRPDIPTHLQYRVPAVRHLAWMCRAPTLLGPPAGFDLSAHLPGNLDEKLAAWDREPEQGPAVLTETPARRLGHYFERLYQCLLEDLLEWPVLAQNQPVRNNGLTLGEMDFIVQNPADRAIEHHEIAVKFYLGFPGSDRSSTLWYGPNARDRLDLKTDRLLSHQSRLSEAPEARALLNSLNIPAPARTRIFMPGYLFYPADHPLSPPKKGVPSDHLRGEWIYIDDLAAFCRNEKRPETAWEQWVPLEKPHWLGPWRQRDEPDRAVTAKALDMVRSAGIPRLFALMRHCPEENAWQEASRLFVMPRTWPG